MPLDFAPTRARSHFQSLSAINLEKREGSAEIERPSAFIRLLQHTALSKCLDLLRGKAGYENSLRHRPWPLVQSVRWFHIRGSEWHRLISASALLVLPLGYETVIVVTLQPLSLRATANFCGRLHVMWVANETGHRFRAGWSKTNFVLLKLKGMAVLYSELYWAL